MTEKLRKFEGSEVIGTTVAIKGAGDGLSKALAIEPRELRINETVYVVIECNVSSIAFEPIKDTSSIQRKHSLRAGTATIVDKELVQEALREQQDKIDAEEAKKRLDFSGDDDSDGAE